MNLICHGLQDLIIDLSQRETFYTCNILPKYQIIIANFQTIIIKFILPTHFNIGFLLRMFFCTRAIFRQYTMSFQVIWYDEQHIIYHQKGKAVNNVEKGLQKSKVMTLSN